MILSFLPLLYHRVRISYISSWQDTEARKEIYPDLYSFKITEAVRLHEPMQNLKTLLFSYADRWNISVRHRSIKPSRTALFIRSESQIGINESLKGKYVQ